MDFKKAAEMIIKIIFWPAILIGFFLLVLWIKEGDHRLFTNDQSTRSISALPVRTQHAPVKKPDVVCLKPGESIYIHNKDVHGDFSVSDPKYQYSLIRFVRRNGKIWWDGVTTIDSKGWMKFENKDFHLPRTTRYQDEVVEVHIRVPQHRFDRGKKEPCSPKFLEIKGGRGELRRLRKRTV